MRRQSQWLTVLALSLSCWAGSALAQYPNHGQRPAILLHVGSITTKNTCNNIGITTSIQANTQSTLGSHMVYLIVARRDSMPSIAGFQCGLYYDNGSPSGRNDGHGIDISDWHLCADFQFTAGPPAPIWPDPYSGNLITWNVEGNCQTGALAVAGYFYVTAYDPGRLDAIPRPIDNLAVVADCQAHEVTLIPFWDIGWVQFSQTGTTPGCNPCWAGCPDLPVFTTTWGAIKALNR